MKMQFVLVMSLGLALVSEPVQAQSTLDKYMKKNTEGNTSTKSQAEVAGINKVYKSAEGYWTLDDKRATGGYCAITYVTPAYFAALYGGGASLKDTFFVFNGPTIPGIKKEKRKQMILTFGDGVAQKTQAIHAPDPVHKEMGTIVFQLSSIQAALDELKDVEHVTIGMDNKQVFSIKWKGGHTARAAMQKCLSSTPSAGAKK